MSSGYFGHLQAGRRLLGLKRGGLDGGGGSRAVNRVEHGGVEFGGRAIEDDAAAGKAINAVGVAPREFDLMETDDGSDAVLAADAMKEREHLVGGGGIE